MTNTRMTNFPTLSYALISEILPFYIRYTRSLCFSQENQDDPVPKNTCNRTTDNVIIRSEIKMYNVFYLTKSTGNKRNNENVRSGNN